MTALPRDVTDLYLAPVVLAVDARIEELGSLDVGGLAYEAALDSDRPDYSRGLREAALIGAISRFVDCHGWEFGWDARGLRLTHGKHTFVLGTPPVFGEYLAGQASVRHGAA